MFFVFGSFVVNDPLHILKVFGLGLAAAILIDATIVRMVLVPSVMELLGPGQLVDPAVARPGAAPDRLERRSPTGTPAGRLGGVAPGRAAGRAGRTLAHD